VPAVDLADSLGLVYRHQGQLIRVGTSLRSPCTNVNRGISLAQWRPAQAHVRSCLRARSVHVFDVDGPRTDRRTVG
jgi:hypothetical protein